MYETDDDLVELLLIPKVGRARARALHAAGFKSISDIAQADPRVLSKVPGIGLEIARGIIKSASDIFSAPPVPDKLETAKELLICPLCGSMVGAGSSVCNGCGIAFSDETEDVAAEELAVENSDGLPISERAEDGFWYKDQGKLFICPECGSMVSNGSRNCPKCGVLFGDDDDDMPEPGEAAKPGEADGYWYKEQSTLFMCPNCGSFIKNDADGCGSCGMVFEAGETEAEPEIPACPMCKANIGPDTKICAGCGFDFTREKETDGFWYKDQGSIFMCPGCGAFIPKDASQCGNCGIVLEEGEEETVQPTPETTTCPMCKGALVSGAKNCQNCGFDFTTDDEKDGFWYKDSVSLFICPGCGAFLAEAADRCMNCGIVFEDEDGTLATGQRAGPGTSDRALEVSKELELERQVDELIELVEIEDELETATAEARKEEAALALDDEPIPGIEKETMTDAPDLGSLYLCPICGAFIQSGMTKCPSCKTVFDDIEEMELEPVGAVQSIVERPEDLAREMAAEIEEIEAELLEPPKPRREEKKGGVSKDFLDRWKKLDSGDSRGSKARVKVPEARKMTGQEVEEELGLEDLIVPIEDVKLEAEIDELADAHSEDEEFWTEKARALAANGKVEEAVASLDRAAELNPERELEYKRLMLELMGVGPRDGNIDLSEIASIDEIGELAIDEFLLADTTQARIGEIDIDLGSDPENGSLWQEKGELLEKLGRHEEAVDCFDRSIRLSYADLRKDSGGLTPRHLMPQIGIGLTNGQGRVNGRVNGLLIQRGLGNGESAGMTNGGGRVNGTGRGRINGMINGLARGRVNGKVNGLTNGRTNGRGLVNGRTNGKVNGQIGRVNGAGMINGRSNGLVNGGLVNGLGLVNGEGVVDGSGSLRRLRHRRRERIMWRYRLSAMVLFVTIILMMSMLNNLMVDDEQGRIYIDGNFADWSDVEGYNNFLLASPTPPGLRILETRISQDGDGLDLFIQFEGDAFAGSGGAGAVDSVWAFVDINPTLDSGYIMNDLGVDLAVEIYGWNHTAMGSNLLRFDNQADRNDWNGFSSVGSAPSACMGSRLETSIRVPRDMAALVQAPRVLVMSLDSDGNSDVTNYLMSPNRGSLAATFRQTGADILAAASGGITMGDVVLSAHSPGEATFRSLDFEVTGNGNASDILNPSLRNPTNQIVPATVVFDDAGFCMTFSVPLNMALNSSTTLTLEAEIAPSASGKTLGIALADANVTGGLVSVQNKYSRLHNIGLPDGMMIDGAFGDWALIPGNPDPADDVLSSSRNASFMNGNIDLAETRFMLNGPDSLFFYLSVQGTIMGGADLPTIRYRPGPVTPTNFTDSDRDSVPDNLDGYYQDFNNDGIPDSQAITVGNLPDVDGDGTADYPDGPDWWLNTTIPLGFQSPYGGKTVSIYIGPVSQTQVENIGDDRAYVLIDADDDAATGANLKGGFGIDFTIVISGKNNRILASELYRHDPANQPTGWSFVRNISAAVDWNRMEGAFDLSALGIASGQNFTLFVSTEDWRGSYDVMDAPFVSDGLSPIPMGGTRAPAGNNVVINEIVAQPSTGEWVELCNPTVAPINISGWRLRQGGNTLVTFPVNTILGAFGSGTEYYVATFYGGGNELPNGGATITLQRRITGTWTAQDATSYPALTAGQSWARFKNVTYGMPTDTDNVADFYISTRPSFREPNDRRCPIIMVSKTGDRDTALPGDQIIYTIFYNNTGDGNARHVWVNDTLPTGVTYVSSSTPYASFAGQIYRWYFNQVAPGAHSFTVVAQVNAGVPIGTLLSNAARLSYTDQLSRTMGASADWFNVTVQIPLPSITVVKKAANPAPFPGEQISFYIYYNNTGSGIASDVWLNDTLPIGLTYVSAFPSPNSVVGQNVRWHFTNLVPGNYQVEIVARVGAGVAIGTVLTNSVRCEYEDAYGVAMTPTTSSAPVTVDNPVTGLVINEICSRPSNREFIEICNPSAATVNIGGWRVRVGGTTLYTFPAGTTIGAWGSGTEYLVVNLGSAADDLPNWGGTVRLQRPGPWTTIDQTAYPGLIVDGQSWSRFKHEDTGKPVDTDTDASDFYVSNNGWIVPEGVTIGAANNRHMPVINVKKTATPITAEPGQTITYTIWYNNTGDGNAKNVWVNDTLPTGVDFVSASPAPTSISGQDIMWFFNNVVHDTTNSVTLNVRMNDLPDDGEIVTNYVELIYHDALKRLMGISGAWANVTCSRPVISVEKTANVAEAVAGGTIVYTIYYNNTGSASAGHVWINDTLPAGVTYVSASTPPNSITGSTLRWHLANVAPGAHSFTVTVTVNATASSGTIVNWAFLDYASIYDRILESGSSSATVIIPEMRTLVVPVFGIMFITFLALRKRRQDNGKEI
jgi:uncharacterized repeat protein (TIGR01451 family)